MIIQLGVVKMRYYLFLIIFLISFAGAVTLDNTVVLNTTSSNSSVTFSFNVNVTNITIELIYVYLYNVSFTNVTGFYDCGEINHSDANTVLDSADFDCNFSEVAASAAEEETVAEEDTGSGGSSTYYPSLDDLIGGYTRGVREGFRVRVPVDNEYHHVKVENIEENKVLVSVSNEVQERWLAVGEEWFVEVSDDNIYDIYVKVDSVSGIYANIYIRSISEMVASKDVSVEVSDDDIGDDGVSDIAADYVKWIVIGASAVLLIAVLVLVILNIRMPAWKKRARRNRKILRRYRKRR